MEIAIRQKAVEAKCEFCKEFHQWLLDKGFQSRKASYSGDVIYSHQSGLAVVLNSEKSDMYPYEFRATFHFVIGWMGEGRATNQAVYPNQDQVFPIKDLLEVQKSSFEESYKIACEIFAKVQELSEGE